MGTDIDIGPLIWVKGEIDLALTRADEAFGKYAENPSDTQQLRFAQTHLHQSHGALAIVGLDGVTQFADAVELVVDELEKGKTIASHATFDLVHNALLALRHYLDEVVAGGRDQPLKLWPLYEKLQAVRGAQAISPGDLFFPDLSVRPNRREPSLNIPDSEIPGLVRSARARFERGFLAWLRSTDGVAGLTDMRDAIAAIEGSQSTPAARSFWWSTLGLIDALDSRHLAVDLTLKRLWGRIGTQLRRFVGGSLNVAERLMRDVLYYVAIAPAATERIRQLKAAYRLDELIPETTAAPDTAPLKPVLRGLRENVQIAKDSWNRFCAGAAVGLPQFAEQVQLIAQRTEGLPLPELVQLAGGIRDAAQWLRKDPLKHSESSAMEIATALLLIENATEQFDTLDADFPRQAAFMAERLARVQRGERLPALEQPLLGEMSRRAQEKLFMSQVAREILNNLAVIEQTLDAYFRDTDRSADLAQLPKPIKQVEGALSILGQEQAVALLRECEDRIAAFFAARTPPEQHDLEDIAHKLSALGFFVEALQHGPADLDAILYPERKKDAIAVEEIAPTVEQELQQRKGEAQALIEALKAQPEDQELRQELKANLETIRESATLVDDTELERQAKDALTALAMAPAGEAAARIEEVVTEIRPSALPTPEPTAAIPPPETAKEEIDAELLGIFIEEASDVLNSIGQNLAASRDEPHNLNVLTTVRRGFHTLKGSGRMVGLKDLGEAAWAVEQVMNRWLQLERHATDELHGMIGLAHGLFASWIAQLQGGGGTHRDAAGLIAACDALRISMEAPVTSPAPVPIAPEERPAEVLLVEPLEEEEHAPAVPSVPAAEEEEIQVGEFAFSRKIFDTYLNETRGHIGILRRELARLHLNPSVLPTRETIRAAHTLAGVSATVGFDAVHDLARALENAMIRVAQHALPATSEQSELLNTAASALEGMIGAIADQRMPHPAPELAADLEILVPVTVELEAADELEAAVELETIDEALAARPFELPVQPEETVSARAPEVLPAAHVIEAVPAFRPVGAPTAAGEAVAHEEKRQLRLTDDIDESLLPIFLEEAQDLLSEINAESRNWHDSPGDADIARSLKRLLHTLKGSARMAGAMSMGEFVHSIETDVEEAVEQSAITPQFLDEFDGSLDRCAVLLDRLRGVPSVEEPAQGKEALPAVVPAAAVAAGVEAELAQQLLRVRADLVDRFVNEAGEISIARSRIEGEMRLLRGSLLDLTENVIRLRNQLRELEIQAESQMQARFKEAEVRNQKFDPLEMDRFTRVQELTRMIAESVNDVSTVQQNLLRNLDGAESALNSQGRLNRDLQQALMSVRMVPFGSVADRLHRIVRQTAKELTKRASLDIRGGYLELDRGVLDRMVGPLEHLLRNAVSHGIESRDERLAAGKSEIGKITLTVTQTGNELSVELTDDGKGLDFDRIRARAIEAGLLAPDARPDSAALAALIFRPGFSTAREVSAIAGRGVGMDVVRDAAQSLGGRVDVASEPGKGAAFRISVPMTLAVMQALLVRAGGRTYAIPSSMIEQVMEVKTEPLARIQEQGQVEWLGNRYPYRYLPRLLGDLDTAPPEARYHWVVLVRAGALRAAVQVDRLKSNQEIVIKKTSIQLARVIGVTGATVLGDGEIVLIINPVVLASRAIERPEIAAPVQPAVARTPERADARPTVMVVDDSLTVRKITSKLLEREGYRVVTAKDGVEALEKMLDVMPEAMIVDIEMPRMDGFDLTRHVRADARLKHVPIIMITSRTAQKHRNYALEIGVNHYLGKPFPEEDLLTLIARYARREAYAAV